VQAHAPTFAIGTPFHSWQMVTQGKTAYAHRAMVQVAKAMVAVGARVITEPALMAAAKADLAARTGKTPYVCPIPEGVEPPLRMSVG
jgi:aminobenzoyl-glutamate utilization protein B